MSERVSFPVSVSAAGLLNFTAAVSPAVEDLFTELNTLQRFPFMCALGGKLKLSNAVYRILGPLVLP